MFALLLSNPSLVDLVAPSFLMKTDAEQKAQYLGRGGRALGEETQTRVQLQTDWLLKTRALVLLFM